MIKKTRFFITACAACLLYGLFAARASADGKIDFNRQVRAILSDKCFACHGPDVAKIKAKLRLEVREVAVKRGAIVPGHPLKIELIIRIFAIFFFYVMATT